MDKKTLVIVVVIVLILCCCVTVGGLTVFYFFSNNLVAPSITPAVKISTAPIESTEAPTTSTKQTKVLTIFDSFNDNTNEWDVGKSEGDFSIFNEYMKDGKLYFDVTAKKSVLVKDVLWSQTIYNFDLSIDTQIITGPDNADIGIIFRKLDPDNYYLFSIRPVKQEYDLYVKKDGEWQEILPWKKSMKIKTEGVNTLRVIANGNKISLYANDELLVEKTNDTINEGGEVGMAADLYSAGDHGLISFDNFDLLTK